MAPKRTVLPVMMRMDLLIVAPSYKCWKWSEHAYTGICQFCPVDKDSNQFSTGDVHNALRDGFLHMTEATMIVFVY
jgi:hypothetical protein